jgi:hypothetical protein
MKFHPYCIILAASAALFATRAESQDGAAASSSSSKNQKAAHAAARQTQSKPNSATETNSYRNATFGFRYDVTYGWVDRTQQMQSEQQAGDPAAASQGKVLLAVFERPPDAHGDTVNSAVVIAQEGASAYPGLKTSADYVGPLTQLVTSQGFKVDGDPTEVTINSQTLVECDFSRPRGKLTMHQSTLVLLQKGTVVSFTFIAGSREDVDALIDRLSFARSAPGKAK